MKITLVGPGIMPIPPIGWGAVEILVWDTKNALEQLGHEVQIVNTKDPTQIIREINSFRPDFVHVHYDEFIEAGSYTVKISSGDQSMQQAFEVIEAKSPYLVGGGCWVLIQKKSPLH